MKMSETIGALTTALIAVQGELPKIVKDKLVQGAKFSYRYVSLDTVMPEALAILNRHGMAITQTVGTGEGGGTTLSTTLLHKSGEWLTDTQPLLLAQEDPQAQGSAITYARRYGLMSALGIVAEDDDDAAAAMPKPSRPAAGQSTEAYGRMADKIGQEKPSGGSGGGKLMLLKYDGDCRICGQPIAKGTNAYYDPATKKVWHERCDGGSAAKQPELAAAGEDPGPVRG